MVSHKVLVRTPPRPAGRRFGKFFSLGKPPEKACSRVVQGAERGGDRGCVMARSRKCFSAVVRSSPRSDRAEGSAVSFMVPIRTVHSPSPGPPARCGMQPVQVRRQGPGGAVSEARRQAVWAASFAAAITVIDGAPSPLAFLFGGPGPYRAATLCALFLAAFLSSQFVQRRDFDPWRSAILQASGAFGLGMILCALSPALLLGLHHPGATWAEAFETFAFRWWNLLSWYGVPWLAVAIAWSGAAQLRHRRRGQDFHRPADPVMGGLSLLLGLVLALPELDSEIGEFSQELKIAVLRALPFIAAGLCLLPSPFGAVPRTSGR